MIKAVKVLHILSACMWLGASASVVLLQCLRGWSGVRWELAALNLDFAFLDFLLIIPGAVGSLLTGFFICKTTSWRFTRYRWVIVKWAGTLAGILVGSSLLGPWQIQMVRLSGQLEGTPLPGSPYDLTRVLFTMIGLLQVFMLIAMVAVSVLKPWGKRVPAQRDTGSVKGQAEVAA